jgi:transposase
VHNTNRQYHLPEIGKKMAYTANRDGGAERLNEAAVQKTIAVALDLITSYDALLKDLALDILKTAQHQDAHTLSLLHTIPGLGKSLRLVLFYDIHDSHRFPRVPDFASYARLVKCRQESGGPRLGTSGNKIGHAHLTWALSEAATVFLRHNEAGQKYRARVEKTQDQGTALSLLAHTLGRAVYYMLKRQGACDRDIFLQASGSRGGEPSASLDTSRDEPDASMPSV